MSSTSRRTSKSGSQEPAETAAEDGAAEAPATEVTGDSPASRDDTAAQPPRRSRALHPERVWPD